MEPVILIDFMNLVFRSHWAFQHLLADRVHTGVSFGVLRTIHALRTEVSKRMIIVWDHGIPVPGAVRPRNWRERVLPTYKSTRKHDGDAHAIVVSQLAGLYDVIQYLGYSHFSVMGMEADDSIGIIAKSLSAHNEVLIFSTDKDFYQLLDENSVHVLVPKKEKGQFRKICQSEVEREYGIPVSRWAEYLAMGGDSSDNIKPRRGMGPKTAIKLIQSGVDLKKPYLLQPQSFREKFTKENFGIIMQSYYASQIPVSCADPRISECLRDAGVTPYTFASLNSRQAWSDPDAKIRGKKQFELFCADRDMASLLSVRHQLFEEREQPRTCPVVNPRTQTRSGPQKSPVRSLI